MDSMVLLVAITIAIVLLLDIVLKRNSSRRRLPPGPLGIPVLGRLPFLSTNLHRSLDNVARSYGPISSFWVGAKLFVVVSSPSAAMEVLKVHDAVFASHAGPIVTSIVSKGGLDILWAPYGSHWRLARRVVMRELLNSTVMDSFRPLRRREVHRMLVRLRSAAEGDYGANIHSAAAGVSMGVILGMIWDDALKDGTDGIAGMVKELLEVIDSIVQLGGYPNVSDFFPVIAPLDLQGLQRRMKALSARLDAVIDVIIEHKKRKAPAEEGEPKDFLQLMLDLIDKKDPDMALEIDHMRGILMDLITAATDTSTSTIEWAMMELMRNPKMMAKAQEELDEVVQKGGILEEWHLSKLPYLEAVVKETLRLYPVLPLMVPHTPSSTTAIGGYTIPQGAWVFVNIWGIQRDPSLWEQPTNFQPERFLEEGSDRFDYNGKSFEFLPFGRGRRICAGLNMGERMVMYVLGTLLHSFNWRLPEGATIDEDENFLIVLKKKDPLVLVPSIRMGQYLQVAI